MSDRSEPAPRRLATWWVVWIAIYNVAFIALLIAVRTAELSFLGFLPTTVWIYGALLIAIAAGNWTIGWILMARRH